MTLSPVLVWIIALGSGLLLVFGGWLLALTRVRSREAATAGLLDQSPLPVGRGAASGFGAELEGEAELVKREVYQKSQRITELEGEKQALAQQVAALEAQVNESQSKMMEMQIEQNTASAMDRVMGSGDGAATLMDALQQETDELRKQVAERDKRIAALESSDSTGMVHELERIRGELMQRNEELAAFEVKLNRAERRATDLAQQLEKAGGGQKPPAGPPPIPQRTGGHRPVPPGRPGRPGPGGPRTVPPLPNVPPRPTTRPPLRRELTSITKRSAVKGRPRRKTGSIFPLPMSKTKKPPGKEGGDKT